MSIEDLRLSPRTLGSSSAALRDELGFKRQRGKKMNLAFCFIFVFFCCRSTSRATPCHAPTSRRPRRGLPGPPSISPTTGATTSSASATRARRACPTQACWKWAGRGSRCATAPATAPRAAPRTVSRSERRSGGDGWPPSSQPPPPND